MSKSDLTEVGYGKKRFYHTRNLAFKKKSILYSDDEAFYESLGGDFYLYKEQSGKKYYRRIGSE